MLYKTCNKPENKGIIQMKNFIKLFLCLSVLLSGPFFITQYCFANQKFEFPEEGLSFGLLPGWKEVGSTKYNLFRAQRNGTKVKIYVSVYNSDPYPKSEEDLRKWTNDWIIGISKVFKFKNLKVIDQGWSTVGNVKAYWAIEEHKMKTSHIKQKIYAVRYNDKPYVFRMAGGINFFNKFREEFEEWVKTIELKKL